MTVTSTILEKFATKQAHLGSALVHFVVALCVMFLLGDEDGKEVRSPSMTIIGANGGTKTVKFLDIKYPLVAFPLITCFFHLLYARLGGAGQLRYLEYSITASIMLVIIQILAGETVYENVQTIIVLMFVTMWCGFFQDLKIDMPKIGNVAFWVGWVPYIYAWTLVITRFFNTIAESNEDPLSEGVPTFVYLIIWIELAFFSLFGVVQWYYVVNLKNYNEQRYEGAYNLLSVTSKVFLVAMAFFGLKGMEVNDSI